MLFLRFKAFVIDMFMIMMPIMYFTTYVIIGSKEQYASSVIAPWITPTIYAVVVILFWYFKAQTPGMRAYDLILIKDCKIDAKDDSNKEIAQLTLFDCVLRYFLFIVSFVFFILLLVAFFRKDSKTIYDILSSTTIVQDDIKDKN